MLHKVLPNFKLLFVDRVKSTYWCDYKQSYEAGSHHTQTTDFFPLLSRSALYFRCSALYLHTSKLNCNGEQISPLTKKPRLQKLIAGKFVDLNSCTASVTRWQPRIRIIASKPPLICYFSNTTQLIQKKGEKKN